MAARADIQQTRQRNPPTNRALRDLPPNGVEQTVQVGSGSRVEITLEARGQEGKSINFLLRERPMHGTLVNLQPLTRNTASVTYVQDPSDPAESDQFSYAVQARDSVVSSATTVPIQIIPLPARVVASPAELDFGAVDVGGVSRAQITLENQGGSVASGQLLPPSPWTVDGSAEYHLRKGERQTFQLVFTPGLGRVFENDLVLGGREDQRVRLVGSGIGKEPVLQTEPSDASGAASIARAEEAARAAAAAAAARAASSQPPAVAPANSATATAASVAAKPADYGPGSVGGGNVSAPYLLDTDTPVYEDGGVQKVTLRWNDSHNAKITWETPDPEPKSYRVELRDLSIDPDKRRLVVKWVAYAKVDFDLGKIQSSATLHGLAAGTRHTLRVVAMDTVGHSLTPSQTLQIEIEPTADWMRITPLKCLVAALLVCLFLLVRRRLEERQLLHEVAERRAELASY